ncbi:facilitated trehalose transporter Tret1 [Lasioglossum baleicum]|uniref:facilitated trehalose transporter Tret1 n=1 Tax=Lasioglossum baleicum TaxID=434251 RepID=UPI003FCD0D05
MSVEMGETVSLKVMWPQWIAGIGVLLLQAQVGFMAGWSSPYIGVLTSPESSFTITMVEVSWVVSLLNLGRLLGAFTGALCVNYFGSKKTILIISVPVFLCWLFVILATNVWWLYSSRFLGGLCLGMLYSSFSLYVAEIADPSIRGSLVGLAMSGLPIGSFLMSAMGPYLSMPVSSAICLVPCLIMMIIFAWLPESPHHLIKVRQDEKAKSSIKWYHPDCDVEQEFLSLKKFVDNNNGQTFLESLMEFRHACYVKSLLIITVLFTYSQLCGLNNMLFYMEAILRNAEVTVIDPAVAVIVVLATSIAGSFLSTVLMDRCGRKMLFILSCICLVLSFISLTITFQLLSFDVHSKALDGLSIFAMMLLNISVYAGLLTVPPAILSELFPPHLKCIAACYASCVAGISSFISTLTYLPLIELMTEQYVYLFYGLLLLTCVPFVRFYVPETKGLSLQEIQRRLVKKK